MGIGRIALGLSTLSLTAATDPSGRGNVLDRVLACRAVAGNDARLACFDGTTASLDVATNRKDIVVVDREQVKQARYSIFGLAVAPLPMLGIGGKGDIALNEITAGVRSARRDRDGQWILTLDDGAVWRQTDQAIPFRDPHAGSKAVIRHGALGTYFIRIDGQMGFRAKRES